MTDRNAIDNTARTALLSALKTFYHVNCKDKTDNSNSNNNNKYMIKDIKQKETPSSHQLRSAKCHVPAIFECGSISQQAYVTSSRIKLTNNGNTQLTLISSLSARHRQRNKTRQVSFAHYVPTVLDH